MSNPSKIFVPNRALGLVSNHVPLSIRYIERRRENLINTVVGKSFHTYGGSKLNLLSYSDPHPDDIQCLTSDTYLVFTACKNIIYAWRRGTELKHTYKGHEANVHLLMPFGPHLLSVDEESTLMIWDIKTEEKILEVTYFNATFRVTVIFHPQTYINKILLGSEQGSLELRNIRKNQVIYTFQGWGKPVTALEQSTSVDQVAIGLESGEIYIHDLRLDKTVMKFTQEWGPVTAISFRTDQYPIMATASTAGHIALWNLDKKQLESEIRNAHADSVTGMKFFPNEPLLVTSSPDNRLKMWIFDMSDGSGRLLRLREGHSEPPLKIRFHGSSGTTILSAGRDSTLRSFSTVVDDMNKSLGQASYNRKVTKKKGIANDPGKMPPITDFTAETTREKEWDNIAACHRELGVVTTWSFDRSRMGDHKILHERFKGSRDVTATCISLTACGNFVLIGYDTGHVDMFNIQSGQFRGTYGEVKAHDGIVRGVCSDVLNQVTVTGGSDKLLKFWRFKTKDLDESRDLEWGIAQIVLHRNSSYAAVALDSYSAVLVDLMDKKFVRKFEGHEGRITDMTFSQGAEWLLTASADSAIRTWDIKTGSLIDCFLVPSVCTSLSMSPTGLLLATSHSGEKGICLWTNVTLYSIVSLHPLPKDYKPQLLDLHTMSLGGKISEESDKVEEVDSGDRPEYKSPEQISNLYTISPLPESHWKSLVNWDVIKEHNKPREPVKAPKSAPFFLPTTSGLNPSFEVDENKTSHDDKISKLKTVVQGKSRFQSILQHCSETDDYKLILDELKQMSPSSIDTEVRCLGPKHGGSVDLLLGFMKVIDHGLKSHREFDLVLAYCSLFNKIHLNTVIREKKLLKFLPELQKGLNEFNKFSERVRSTLESLRALENMLQ